MGEQHFVYGNHVVKAHLKRITEDIPKNSGVVVFNENDVPLGFGVSAKSTTETTSAGAEAIVVYHQADIGEYLRDESGLVWVPPGPQNEKKSHKMSLTSRECASAK